MRSSHNLYLAAGIALLGASALTTVAIGQTARITQPATTSGTMPASPRVPVGVTFAVKMLHDLDTRTVTEGTNWDGILVNDMIAPNGRRFAESGGTVTGIVSIVQPSSKDLTATISLRAVALNGVEFKSMDTTRGGGDAAQAAPPNGRIPAMDAQAGGTRGQAGGFAAAGNNGQEKIRAGAVLTFTTTAP